VGAKAAGVVIDDAAVTPKLRDGFAARHELPIVSKIAAGSLRNKLLILLHGALALSYFRPHGFSHGSNCVFPKTDVGASSARR
jgi:predicted DNA repair protein MutK